MGKIQQTPSAVLHHLDQHPDEQCIVEFTINISTTVSNVTAWYLYLIKCQMSVDT